MALENPRDRRARAWVAAGKDRTLRLDYDLTAESIVFDLGGYEGQWASDIFSMYGCTVHVFEPVGAFAERIEERFRRNERIKVHRFGLAQATYTTRISVEADQSSTFAASRSSAARQMIELVCVADFLASHDIEAIDLMKVNIEGGEFDLLDHMLDKDLIRIVRDLQVQFHDFVPDAERRMRDIRRRLGASHDPTYQVDFVWENWRRR